MNDLILDEKCPITHLRCDTRCRHFIKHGKLTQCRLTRLKQESIALTPLLNLLRGIDELFFPREPRR